MLYLPHSPGYLCDIKIQDIMEIKTLLFVLLAVVAVAAIAFSFYHKMDLASRGHRLDWSDGDSVTVSEEDLQDFMFEMQASEEPEPVKGRTEIFVGRGHAVA